MSSKLTIYNVSDQTHESVVPALDSVAETIIDSLDHGKADEARRFMSVQYSLGFVESCLYRQDMGEKKIEAVLLH